MGDFGFGFNKKSDERMLKWQAENPNHLFIRGNHDDRAVCRESDNFIEDGEAYIWDHLMCIGGAWSIDYAQRREGRSWWPDEECSSEEFDRFTETYLQAKPRVMVTHDAPMQIPNWHKFVRGDLQITRTGLRLGQMWQKHKPDLWVFGHWHLSFDKTVEGTRFICLNINEWVDLDLNTLEVT